MQSVGSNESIRSFILRVTGWAIFSKNKGLTPLPHNLWGNITYQRFFVDESKLMIQFSTPLGQLALSPSIRDGNIEGRGGKPNLLLMQIVEVQSKSCLLNHSRSQLSHTDIHTHLKTSHSDDQIVFNESKGYSFNFCHSQVLQESITAASWQFINAATAPDVSSFQ